MSEWCHRVAELPSGALNQAVAKCRECRDESRHGTQECVRHTC